MTEQEQIELTPAMRNLIRRRTSFVALDFINYEQSLKTALAQAYLAGMNDAIDVLHRKFIPANTESNSG